MREGSEQQSSESNELGTFITAMFMNKRIVFTSTRKLKTATLICLLFFLLLTVITSIVMLQVKKVKVKYADGRECADTQKFAAMCGIEFVVHEDVSAPVYVLYYVENIYINHKKYLKSWSRDQLSGTVIDAQQAEKECFPIVYNRDLPYTTSYGGWDLDPDAIASPCGLKPLLMFNDSYTLSDKFGTNIPIDQTAIVREDPKYKKQVESEKFQWTDPTNEHFKVYMLDGSLMTKKRLWGVINQDLKADKYTLTATNNYQVNQLNIKKGVELTNSSVIGSIGLFFPLIFLAISVGCLVYYILVTVKLNSLSPSIQYSYQKYHSHQ